MAKSNFLKFGKYEKIEIWNLDERQQKKSVFDLLWNTEGVTYKDIHHRSEKEFSKYNFDLANTEILLKIFNTLEQETKSLIVANLPLPAYDQALKASHVFNILDARGVISIAQRAEFISRIRELVKGVGEKWLKEDC